MIEENKYYELNDFGFLFIEGENKDSFLQGLISNDIHKLKTDDSIYSALLTPQGKFLFDFFISNFDGGYLIECKKDNLLSLHEKLDHFKLRSNIKISTINNLKSYLINLNNKKYFEVFDSSDLISFKDPRFLIPILKVYSCEKNFKNIMKKMSLTEISKIEFNFLRIKNTIPDFSKDSIKNKSLLLEMRFDELSGINWKKGCYMGQEITAITKYRGKIKRKLFGVEINGILKTDTISHNEKEIGYFTSKEKKFGIAYLNENEALNLIDNNTTLNIDDAGSDAKLKFFVPKWAK